LVNYSIIISKIKIEEFYVWLETLPIFNFDIAPLVDKAIKNNINPWLCVSTDPHWNIQINKLIIWNKEKDYI